MSKNVSFAELVQKVNQQEKTVAQLLKILAATNHRISELKIKYEHVEKLVSK